MNSADDRPGPRWAQCEARRLSGLYNFKLTGPGLGAAPRLLPVAERAARLQDNLKARQDLNWKAGTDSDSESILQWRHSAVLGPRGLAARQWGCTASDIDSDH